MSKTENKPKERWRVQIVPRGVLIDMNRNETLRVYGWYEESFRTKQKEQINFFIPI